MDPWVPATSYDQESMSLVGPWYWGPTGVGVRLDAEGLLHLDGLTGSARAARFRRGPDGTWVGLDGYYTGEVLRPTAGGQSFRIATFVFTREPYGPAQAVPGGVHDDGWHPQD